MGTTIRELLVRLGVKTDAKALGQFDQRLATTKTRMTDLVRSATLLTGGLFAVAGAAVKAAVDTATAGDEAAKAAKRVGITAEQYQELAFAADRSGAELQDVETGLRQQARSAAEAAEGVATYADAYKKLGVDVVDANGVQRDQIAILEDVAEGLKGITSEGEKISLASQIFGRGGSKLLPLLKEGRAGIRDLRAEARRLGLVMSEDAAARSEEFLDRMSDMKAAASGLRNTIGLALLPTMTRLVARTTEWLVANRDWIRQKAEVAAERVAKGFDRVLQVVRKANDAVRMVGGWGTILKGVAGAIATVGLVKTLGVISALVQTINAGLIVLAGVVGGTTALAGAGILAVILAFLAEMAIVMAPTILAVTTLALAVEDLIVFLRGGDSLLGRFLARLGLSEQMLNANRQAMAAVVAVLERFGGIASAVFGIVAGLGRDAFASIRAAIDPVLSLILRLTEAVLGVEFTTMIRDLDTVAAVLRTIEGALGKVEGFLGGVDTGLEQRRRSAPVIPSTSLTGLAAQSLGAATSTVIRNTQIDSPVQIDIQGVTDPVAVGEEVARTLSELHRRTRAEFAGGER